MKNQLSRDGGTKSTGTRVIRIYVCICAYIYIYNNYHCKKEGIVMTNFGHLSCTQDCCEPLSKEWKN